MAVEGGWVAGLFVLLEEGSEVCYAFGGFHGDNGDVGGHGGGVGVDVEDGDVAAHVLNEGGSGIY